MSDVAGGADDLEAVERERDRLAAEVQRLEDRPRRRERRRGVVALILVILTFVAMTAAVPGVWARRTLLDTDRYVATVDDLATQPAIQQALATEITAAVFEALDVQDRLSSVIGERLPELRFLAGPISTAIQGFVQEQVLKVVQSQAFITFWSEANRFVHEQALAVLRGDSEAVTVQGDQVVLSYLPLVNRALADLSGLLSDLLGRSITLPTITEDTVPTQAISMLETALGVDLPETFGQVVIYEGDDLGALQQVFRMTNALIILLVLLVLVMAAAAIAISPRRRRTILQLAVGILVVTVFERRLAISGTNSIVEDVPAAFQPAAEATGQVLLDSLLSTTLWILLAMLAVIVAAVLSGPYPWVVAFRSWVGDVASGTAGAARAADRSPAVAWIRDHRDGVMAGVAIAAVAIWLIADLSFGGLFLLAVVAAIAEFLVYRVGATDDEQVPTPPDGG